MIIMFILNRIVTISKKGAPITVKKIFSVFMSLLMILTLTTPVYATETVATTEHPETTEYPDNPSKEPDLVANAAIVMDVESGKIL